MTPDINHPGQLILGLIEEFEHQNIPTVYLRNYESLPQCVGNDVDLLIPAGTIGKARVILQSLIKNTHWAVFNAVEFGPLSIFLVNSEIRTFLHIDLFERLDWHWLPFADAASIIARRQWNGMIHHAHLEDEIYLNVLTRLIYHGTVREKHRTQARCYFADHEGHTMNETVRVHLGQSASQQLGSLIAQANWAALEATKSKLRATVVKQAFIRRFGSTLTGLLQYLKRSMRRVLAPPGPFVVFEGADGVGKSTLIETLIPVFQGLTGRKDTLLFHWKPTQKSIRLPGQQAGEAMDPRANQVRPLILSLFYLSYHWLGFWIGYFRHVYPARIKNRAVVGDRYSYEFFLDPRRLRLSAPDWILRLAAHTVPLPQTVIALVADPSVITRRKPELSHSEIESYQEKLRGMADKTQRVVLIDTTGTVDSVATEITTRILSHHPHSK